MKNYMNFGEIYYDALLRKIDSDSNSKITKNEFCEALLPTDLIGQKEELFSATKITTERNREHLKTIEGDDYENYANIHPSNYGQSTAYNFNSTEGTLKSHRKFIYQNPITINERFNQDDNPSFSHYGDNYAGPVVYEEEGLDRLKYLKKYMNPSRQSKERENYKERHIRDTERTLESAKQTYIKPRFDEVF